MKHRPCGITLLGLTFLFFGGLSLLFSLVVFGLGGVSWLTGSLFSPDSVAMSGGVRMWAGILGIVSAAVQLLAGIGLLALKTWGWWLAFLGIGLTVVQGVVGMFSGGLLAFCCGGFGVLLPLAVLFYLLTPGVRSAFRRSGPPPAMEVYLSTETHPTAYPPPPPSSPQPQSLPPPEPPVNP